MRGQSEPTASAALRQEVSPCPASKLYPTGRSRRRRLPGFLEGRAPCWTVPSRGTSPPKVTSCLGPLGLRPHSDRLVAHGQTRLFDGGPPLPPPFPRVFVRLLDLGGVGRRETVVLPEEEMAVRRRGRAFVYGSLPRAQRHRKRFNNEYSYTGQTRAALRNERQYHSICPLFAGRTRLLDLGWPLHVIHKGKITSRHHRKACGNFMSLTCSSPDISGPGARDTPDLATRSCGPQHHHRVSQVDNHTDTIGTSAKSESPSHAWHMDATWRCALLFYALRLEGSPSSSYRASQRLSGRVPVYAFGRQDDRSTSPRYLYWLYPASQIGVLSSRSDEALWLMSCLDMPRKCWS